MQYILTQRELNDLGRALEDAQREMRSLRCISSSAARALDELIEASKIVAQLREYRSELLIRHCLTRSSKSGETLAHEELKNRALIWLSNKVSLRGIRASFEMNLEVGYTVDVLALCRLQWRIAENYYGKAFTELPSSCYRDASGWLCRSDTGLQLSRQECESLARMTDAACLFEVKVSRADFFSVFGASQYQKRGRCNPQGDLHWIVAPKGLLKPEEVPAFWGLLEASGHGLHQTKKPEPCKCSIEQRALLAEEILWNQKPDRTREINYCPDCEREL